MTTQCAAVMICLSVTREPAHCHDTLRCRGYLYPRAAIHGNNPAPSYINVHRDCLTYCEDKTRLDKQWAPFIVFADNVIKRLMLSLFHKSLWNV